MAQVDSENTTALPIATTRRRFLSQAAAVAAGGSALALSVQPKTAVASSGDARLLEMEREILKLQAKIDEFKPEIARLHDILASEFRRLSREAAAGINDLSERLRLDMVRAMPEHAEHSRVCDEQQAYYDVADRLVKEMWSLEAETSEGKAAKFSVWINYIMTSDWRESDKDADYDIEMTRRLLVEMIGGEPAEKLRARFASVQS